VIWTRSAVTVFFCGALTSSAHARSLNVTRGPGAENCPDAEQLTSRVEALRGGARSEMSRGYRVRFTREGERVTAAIRPSSGRGLRLLHATEQACSALAKATAVTLALLLDSRGELEDEIQPSEVPPAPPDSSAPSARPHVERRRSSASTPTGFTASLGGAALVGVVRPVAPALLADAGLQVQRLRTSLGALWVAPQDSELGPGVVRASLLTGVVRGCFVPWLSRALELGTCSGALIGVVSAEGSGYTHDERRNKTFIAVPVELSLAHSFGPAGLELGAAALFVLRRYDFAVEGLGVAYRSLPVGALISLRGYGFWSW